jgi:hypothetical protein
MRPSSNRTDPYKKRPLIMSLSRKRSSDRVARSPEAGSWQGAARCGSSPETRSSSQSFTLRLETIIASTVRRHGSSRSGGISKVRTWPAPNPHFPFMAWGFLLLVVGWRLTRALFVCAGELFSVAPWMAKRLENLFALNECVALLGRWRHLTSATVTTPLQRNDFVRKKAVPKTLLGSWKSLFLVHTPPRVSATPKGSRKRASARRKLDVSAPQTLETLGLGSAPASVAGDITPGSSRPPSPTLTATVMDWQTR